MPSLCPGWHQITLFALTSNAYAAVEINLPLWQPTA